MAYRYLDNVCLGYQKKEGELSLKDAVAQFLHDKCEGLRYESDTEENKYVNQQREVDRLCLERALERFLESGTAEDAFDVYFCYLEMFVGSYGSSKEMIEMLSEFETNGSSLLMKHRDHYSHSVYVFALGLAFYDTNSNYRNKYKEFYKLEDDGKAVCHFLEYWGLSSLFHDIGYPFELPFEQLESYFEIKGLNRQDASFMAYSNMDSFISIGKEEDANLQKVYGIRMKEQYFKNTDELFAYDLAKKLGAIYHFTKESMQNVLGTKPTSPDRFGYYMDHAYFSASVLYQELVRADKREGQCRTTAGRLDALTAIIMHNSLYKFAIAFYKNKELNIPFRMEYHPLAYMLMLCDELQCWDRIAYGRNSRRQLHPMDCELKFSDNAVNATYIYDKDEENKVQAFEESYKQDKNAKLKAYSDMVHDNTFLKDINAIINSDEIGLTVDVELRERNFNRKHQYLSQSNYINLYHFAVALNARYKYGETESECSEKMEEDFNSLTLEYKLSNIRQAKAFAKHLDAIGCFFTDKPVDFEMVTEFSKRDIQHLGMLEHERWLMEHKEMGWKFGDSYMQIADKEEARQQREFLREHKLMLKGDLSRERIKQHYDELPEEEKVKDFAPMNSMLKLIENYDGLRIYRL